MKPFKSGSHELKPAKKPEDVTSYGVWLLGRRDHSTHELRIKLARKTDNQEWLEAAIKQLIDWRYHDEQRFIDNFLKNCNEVKKYGPIRVKQEFKLKGVDKELVNFAMEESEFDYFESALELLNKKARNPIEDKKERDRLTRFLLSKGYSFDMIRYAFDEHLKSEEDE